MIKSEISCVKVFLLYYMELEAGNQRMEVFEVFEND